MADKMNTDYWSKFYGGGMNPSVPFIPEPGSLGYSPGLTFQPGMMGRGIASVGSPNLTAAEQQLLNQQIQQSQALQAGYNPDGTPKPIPATPSVGVPVPAATWNSIDQAAYDARNKPGTWLAQSRMNAQALMRQMAVLQGGMPMAPGTVAPAAVPARGGGLAALITGSGTPRAQTGGLVSLLGPTGTAAGYRYENGKKVGQSSEYAGMSPSQQYDAVNAKARATASKKIGGSSSSGSSSGNLGGVSSSGRRYDYDNNTWV